MMAGCPAWASCDHGRKQVVVQYVGSQVAHLHMNVAHVRCHEGGASLSFAHVDPDCYVADQLYGLSQGWLVRKQFMNSIEPLGGLESAFLAFSKASLRTYSLRT